MLNACEPCVYVHNVPCNVCAIDAHTSTSTFGVHFARARARTRLRLAKTTRGRVFVRSRIHRRSPPPAAPPPPSPIPTPLSLPYPLRRRPGGGRDDETNVAIISRRDGGAGGWGGGRGRGGGIRRERVGKGTCLSSGVLVHADGHGLMTTVEFPCNPLRALSPHDTYRGWNSDAHAIAALPRRHHVGYARHVMLWNSRVYPSASSAGEGGREGWEGGREAEIAARGEKNRADGRALARILANPARRAAIPARRSVLTKAIARCDIGYHLEVSSRAPRALTVPLLLADPPSLCAVIMP